MKKEIRPAATVVILRDGVMGIEVFLLRRNPNIGASHFGDALVFPGGVLDPEDEDSSWTTFCDNPNLFGNGSLAGANHSALSFWVAAIRECYEEAGILFGRRQNGEPIAQEKLQDWRKELDSISFFDLVHRENLQLLPNDLIYYSHWITPDGRPQRFDTRFFLARCPEGQQGCHDGFEAIDSNWMTAEKVLTQFHNSEITLWPPTQYTLLTISEFQRVEDMLRFMGGKSPTVIPPILPKLLKEDGGIRPIFPWDEEWA